jgi:hypothetical protein
MLEPLFHFPRDSVNLSKLEQVAFRLNLRPMGVVSSGDKTDRTADSLVHLTDDGIRPRLVDRFGHTVPTAMASSAIVVSLAIRISI